MAVLKVEQFAKELSKELGLYSSRLSDDVQKAVDVVSKEAAEELKAKSPKRSGSGHYAKDWTFEETYRRVRTKRTTVYNRSHYQLTHLLEHGHALKRGGRKIGDIGAKVHIAPVEARASEKLKKAVEEAAKG